MARTAVSSDQAPDALGPYSQAIVAGGMVFCSGMAGIDPATGTVADGIEAQTDQALRNLAAVLSAAEAPPARSAPANVRLPRGLLVSIEAIAVLPSPST
jgi:2-iminobutanoate/2-iminopropanoate deaminase